jgi:hypothetical protein
MVTVVDMYRKHANKSAIGRENALEVKGLRIMVTTVTLEEMAVEDGPLTQARKYVRNLVSRPSSRRASTKLSFVEFRYFS